MTRDVQTAGPAGVETAASDPSFVGTPRRARSLAIVLLAAVAVATTTVAWAVRGIVHEHERSDVVTEPVLSAESQASLGVGDTVRLLWEEPAAAAVARVLTTLPDVAMTDLYEFDLYSTYAFATGVDPRDDGIALHAEWRRGAVTGARVRLAGSSGGGGQRSSLPTFTLDQVPWSQLGRLMDEAVRRLGVKHPDVRYLQIDAGLYGGTGLTLRAYVSGPNASGGLVEADASGTIVRVVPDSDGARRQQ